MSVLTLKKVLAEGLKPEAFGEMLQGVGLSQAELARMGGFSIGNVNRWCSSFRKDRVPVPRHAIVMAAMYGMLSSDARAALRASL